MRFAVGMALIGVLCLVIGCGKSPKSSTPEASGLWRVTSRDGASPSPEFRLEYCAPVRFDPPIDEAAFRLAGMRDCAVATTHSRTDRFELVKTCPLRPQSPSASRVLRITTRLSGSFKSDFREVTSAMIKTVKQTDFRTRETSELTAERTREWRRMGDCPAGMRPGERRLWSP